MINKKHDIEESMESHKIGIFGAVFAVAAGLLGTGVFSDSLLAEESANSLQEKGSLMTGHVEYTVHDKDGNVKEYIQTDNVVTRLGIDCAISFLFDNSTVDGSGGSTEQCGPSAGYTGHNYIAIGNASAVDSPVAADTALTDEMTGDNGITRKQDSSVTFTPATGNADSATAVIETESDYTFTQFGSDGTTITESGLFDVATGGAGNMFAYQTFSTDVTNQDSLSVKWTITVQ